MLKLGSFDVYMNTTALIIVILDYSEINIEVSSTDMKTAESDDCRGVLWDNRDTNDVLTII